MKRLACLAALALAAASAGCTPEMSWSPQPEALTHRLRTLKDTCFEYEPLEFTLVTVNNSSEPRNLGIQDQGGYLVIHEITDNDEISWRPIPVEQDVTGQQIMPGETVDLRVSDLTGKARLTKPGTWIVSYRYFQETGSRQRLLFATPDLHLRCVDQALVVPAGTPAEVSEALQALTTAPAHAYISQYPAWTEVNRSEPMQRLLALGNRAAPALMANLDNYRLRPAIIQVLTDLRYGPAIPRLISMLRMNDSVQDRLILTALGKITGIPKGFEYYTNWSQSEVKEAALAAYRAWSPAAGNRQ
jgi:hypothetical protein